MSIHMLYYEHRNSKIWFFLIQLILYKTKRPWMHFLLLLILFLGYGFGFRSNFLLILVVINFIRFLIILIYNSDGTHKLFFFVFIFDFIDIFRCVRFVCRFADILLAFFGNFLHMFF